MPGCKVGDMVVVIATPKIISDPHLSKNIGMFGTVIKGPNWGGDWYVQAKGTMKFHLIHDRRGPGTTPVGWFMDESLQPIRGITPRTKEENDKIMSNRQLDKIHRHATNYGVTLKQLEEYRKFLNLNRSDL